MSSLRLNFQIQLSLKNPSLSERQDRQHLLQYCDQLSDLSFPDEVRADITMVLEDTTEGMPVILLYAQPSNFSHIIFNPHKSLFIDQQSRPFKQVVSFEIKANARSAYPTVIISRLTDEPVQIGFPLFQTTHTLIRLEFITEADMQLFLSNPPA